MKRTKNQPGPATDAEKYGIARSRSVKMTDDEWTAIQKAASVLGITASELTRDATVGKARRILNGKRK